MIRSQTHRRRLSPAFTLIELLVVISIIAILLAILVPTLASTRKSAMAAKSLSNFHQLGLASAMYLSDGKNWFWNHECTFDIGTGQFYRNNYAGSDSIYNAATVAMLNADKVAVPNALAFGAHWEDQLVRYVSSVPDVFLSPLLQPDTTVVNSDTAFWNYLAIPPFGDPTKNPTLNTNPRRRGGYGYNGQYLGFEYHDASAAGGDHGFAARMDGDIIAPASTVLLADTAGTKKGIATNLPSNSYMVEPPLPSLNLGAKLNDWYGTKYQNLGLNGDPVGPGPYNWNTRTYPAPRNNGIPNFLFTDGHAKAIPIEEIDDFNRDGTRDNGYWNGKADPSQR